MKIATVLNVHGNEELTSDTLNAIQTYMTKDVLIIIDGAKWQEWGKNVSFGVPKLEGFYHNSSKSPYRNVALGLMKLSENWTADWYCYIEYDVLVASDAFKEDLESAANRNVWCIGNDLRTGNIKFPLLEKMTGIEFNCSKYLLGCCVFFHCDFIKKLKEMNFWEKFLYYTNTFSAGWFPDYTEHDISEHMYPTLAHHLGGRVEQFAKWNQHSNIWTGNHRRYPMRFRPDIENAHLLTDASIIHPMKQLDESRKILKGRRHA